MKKLITILTIMFGISIYGNAQTAGSSKFERVFHSKKNSTHHAQKTHFEHMKKDPNIKFNGTEATTTSSGYRVDRQCFKSEKYFKNPKRHGKAKKIRNKTFNTIITKK